MRHVLRNLALAAPLLLAISAVANGHEAESSTNREALRQRAFAECRKPEYPSDTKIRINYAKGWFRCDLPEWYNSKGRRIR